MNLSIPFIRQKTALSLIIIIFLCLWPGAAESLAAHSNILIINSYEPNNPWTITEENGLKQGLENENMDVRIYHEYMDTKRISGSPYDVMFTQYLAEKYKGQQIDLIVTTDDYATLYVKKFKQQFVDKQTPVVFVGVNDLGFQAESFVGVYERTDIEGTVELIKSVHGDKTPILLVTDKTLSSASIIKHITSDIAWLKDNQVEVVAESDLTKLKQRLGAFNQGAVIFLLFNEDAQGNRYTYYEGLNQIRDYTALPIYSVWDFYLGHGIVGGSLITEKEMGEHLARMVARVLSGEKITNLKSQETTAQNILDYQTMSRFGIEKSKVAAVATVVNEPNSFWSEYYQLMMLFVGTIFIFIVVIGLLINSIRQKNEYYRTISEHKNEMVQSNQKLEKKLADSQEVNKKLTARNLELVKLILSLKKRVGFSERLPVILHEINTMLGGIHSRIDYIQGQSDRLERNESQLSSSHQFDELREILNESIVSCEVNMEGIVRLISATKTCYSDLNESEYKNYKIHSFIDAFWQMLKPTLKKKKVSFSMNVPEELSLYGNPGDFLTILAILFGNSLRHGYPMTPERELKLEVEAYSSQSYVHIIYKDDGEGCSTDKLEKGLKMSIDDAVASGSGIGLYQLNEIVTGTMGGQISISGDYNVGMQVRIIIPKAGEMHDNRR